MSLTQTIHQKCAFRSPDQEGPWGGFRDMSALPPNVPRIQPVSTRSVLHRKMTRFRCS